MTCRVGVRKRKAPLPPPLSERTVPSDDGGGRGQGEGGGQDGVAENARAMVRSEFQKTSCPAARRPPFTPFDRPPHPCPSPPAIPVRTVPSRKRRGGEGTC